MVPTQPQVIQIHDSRIMCLLTFYIRCNANYKTIFIENSLKNCVFAWCLHTLLQLWTYIEQEFENLLSNLKMVRRKCHSVVISMCHSQWTLLWAPRITFIRTQYTHFSVFQCFLFRRVNRLWNLCRTQYKQHLQGDPFKMSQTSGVVPCKSRF